MYVGGSGCDCRFDLAIIFNLIGDCAGRESISVSDDCSLLGDWSIDEGSLLGDRSIDNCEVGEGKVGDCKVGDCGVGECGVGESGVGDDPSFDLGDTASTVGSDRDSLGTLKGVSRFAIPFKQYPVLNRTYSYASIDLMAA